jgi:hypothetical protein
MEPEKKKLLLLAGVGVVVLYLFSRARAASSPTSQAAAADPLQGVAQQLAAQRAAQQAQLDYSKAAVQNQIDVTNLQFGEFKQLAADPAYACPGGGRPRWIPGQGPGCIGPKSSGGGFLGSFLGALSGYFSGGRVTTGAGGSSGSYTPPIRGNSFF